MSEPRDYSDLEKRLEDEREELKDCSRIFGEPSALDPITAQRIANTMFAAQEAIAELTKRCEEEYARGLEDAARIAETAMSRYADYENDPACESAVGAGNEIAAAIRASQRQLPSHPLPDDPANGDENAERKDVE